MKVHPQEEAMVREAAEKINGMLQSYKEMYNQVDIQDLLSMVVLDTVIEKLQLQRKSNEAEAAIAADLTSLIQLIDRGVKV
jgi:cell division protein ZapA (FtsZ GTPase activity inhibitor)